MSSGFQLDDLGSSLGRSFNESFQKFNLDYLHHEIESSPGPSLDESFRNSNSGVSSRKGSTSISAASKFYPSSKRSLKILKDFASQFLDVELLKENLEEWVDENLQQKASTDGSGPFSSPFTIEELRMLDFALEGMPFRQLVRMPCSSFPSDNPKEDEYLALEDFLYTIADSLWHAFWYNKGPFQYYVSCPHFPGTKFYTVEKAISRGRLDGISGAALVHKTRNQPDNWNEVVQFALFRQPGFSSTTICEALFYGIRILLTRASSKYNAVSCDSVFIPVVDSEFGWVLKLGGDLSKLDIGSNPYESVADWIKCHAKVNISSVDRIWNMLGNPNWGDIGTLQLVLATFYSFSQWNGLPGKSIVSLASEHSLRLHKRRMKHYLIGHRSDRDEILSTQEEQEQQTMHLKLKTGDTVLLEDDQLDQKRFQIQKRLRKWTRYTYSAIALEYPSDHSMLFYVGAHSSRLEPSWEDMSLWYQVKRQTKVLNILNKQGISSKYLPKIVSSGRILHPGPCEKESPSGRCDHPWCGTPVLVTYPIGEPISSVVARDGKFSSLDAICLCRDSLTALRSAKMACIQHGDICPENVIRVTNSNTNGFYYVPISWGRAVLDEKDSPAINLQFSSAHALQHGKLCPSSDAESLVYLIYLVCGGNLERLDSIESALQWRQKCWEKRLIQQQLGEVSAVLKAFTDYIDSLSGTPYPVDYDIWLKRLNRAVEDNSSADRGKLVVEEDIAESSGASPNGNSLSS
ncbi:uncharacterized protein LOC124919104 [Impatiens glandulifera]|uniref:uncharacterized protein LOC124919104 n=1 Tax=Impatiens glandulifera TaxID=253017 RepID=UPI001FB0BA23|nr:uncharacterized protein LOC124919104 [Impatiens glandulifera]